VSLFARSFLLIAALIVTAVLASFQIYRIYELEPRSRELAQQTVSTVNLTRAALVSADPFLRRDLLVELNETEGLRVFPATASEKLEPLPDDDLLERVEARVRAALGADTRFAVARDGEEGFLVSFFIDEDEFWVMLPRERFDPEFGLQWVGWGAGLLALVATLRNAGEGWGLTALVTAAFVAWITLINLVYLVTQIVIASDGCTVATAIPRAVAFIRRERRTVGGVFLIVLVLVIFATGASVLATTALGLIAFVPLFGFIFIPLSLLAWMLRAVVFQYIGLSSLGAYLKLYREANPGLVEGRVHRHDRLREVPFANGTSTH